MAIFTLYPVLTLCYWFSMKSFIKMSLYWPCFSGLNRLSLGRGGPSCAAV